jgi:FkbM family methyltransferase
MSVLKQLASKLPEHWQAELKRLHFSRQIKRNKFSTEEPEFKILNEFIQPGDWVIDVGANVGHYTKRFSELVGLSGRVIAFEPVSATFALLSANTQLFTYPNVTLINAAVSDRLAVVGMSIPKFSSGLSNYYCAHLTSEVDGTLPVLTLSLDSIDIEQKVVLVKIDAEGHEAIVLAGMQKLMELHHPTLIVENPTKETRNHLSSLGYDAVELPNSPNVLFKSDKG